MGVFTTAPKGVRTPAMRLLGLAAVIATLGGCAQVLTVEPTTRIGALNPGPAEEASNFFGVTYEPCSAIQLEGYPANLARASHDYYQGPWCARAGDTRSYLWAYARAMGPDQSSASVGRDVLADAEQLVLDMEAQGYLRVCGQVQPGVTVDAGFENASEPTRIRVSKRGLVADPPTATSIEPPSLVVALSPATRAPSVPAGEYAPPC